MSVIRVLSRLAGISLILMAGASSVRADPELTLTEAERLALQHAPWLSHHRTNVAAMAERVTYEGRLPDPQLTVGMVNVPTDTYRLDQEDMTMVNVGIRQAFPPGDTLKLRSRRAEKELSREEARLEMERRNLLLQVRDAWLDLYFADESLRFLRESRQLAVRQRDAAEGRFRAAAVTQQEVLQAREELARLDEREQDLRAQSERRRAQLARWIGEPAYAPLPEAAPPLPDVPERFEPARHPEWIAAQAGLEEARLDVDIARQEYRPGMTFDLSYGARQSRPDGQSRPDLVSAMVTFDLPIFRSKRQDRRLAEKQAMQAAAQFETEDRRRELEARYRAVRAEHEALAARVKIYTERLLPDIEREARVTVSGFARDVTGLREARRKELEAKTELVRLRVDLAKSQAELLYLIGEDMP
ncbi:MAG TPA: TolC family protein [Candidatus Methylomirabilis sp.]|nr:TolC family protein [Candidatus Methylomirabilis sp.]